MRQNSTANSTQHTPHGPSGPIGRLGAAGPRAPTQRAQNRTCASAHEGYSTHDPTSTQTSASDPSWAHSTCYTHSHAACRSPVTSRHALPSLLSAQHAHTPAGARTSRARTARPAHARRGSFRSRKWGVKATRMPIAFCARCECSQCIYACSYNYSACMHDHDSSSRSDLTRS